MTCITVTGVSNSMSRSDGTRVMFKNDLVFTHSTALTLTQYDESRISTVKGRYREYVQAFLTYGGVGQLSTVIRQQIVT